MSCGRTGEGSSADVKKASQNSPRGSLHVSAQTGFSELKSIRVSVRRKGVCALAQNAGWIQTSSEGMVWASLTLQQGFLLGIPVFRSILPVWEPLAS